MGKKRRRGVRAALFPASSLTNLVANGLQAVSGIDRDRITVDPSDHVHDSLALDRRDRSTGEWDYLLGVDEQQRPVIGVEVHPATNGEVAAVIAKQQRSVLVLRNHMAVTDIRRWIWISSGKDTVSRGSAEWRKLIKARIELVGRHLSLP
jgi:hypothetical protein